MLGCGGVLHSRPPVHFTTPTLPVARVFHQIRATTSDRTSLQRDLGLSQANITRHVAALMGAGLVEEVHRTWGMMTPRLTGHRPD